MSEVRTRDEAIATVDQGMRRWATEAVGLVTQSQNTTSIAVARAEEVVRNCANQVAAIEAAMTSASEEQRALLQARLACAREAYDTAVRARVRVREVEARIARLSRTVTLAATSEVPEARAQLAAMSSAIERYRTGEGVFGGGVSQSGGTPLASRGPYGAAGIADLDVLSADLEENPILDDYETRGTFGKGGLSRADYRWAVQTWNDVVGPGVARGKTREDFAERDRQSSARPLRRTADVYDMFLGSDRIRVDRRPDGSLNIVSGRHRFQIARELGIKTLPGEVSSE